MSPEASRDVPRVSIGLPVFNGADFLEETLSTVLTQTFSDFELVISDNASTDATEEICRAIAERDSRVRYFRNETNMGAAWNYNRVFELARGEFFKWQAADDKLHPEFLEKCLREITDRPDTVLSYPDAIVIDEHGNTIDMEKDALCFHAADPTERFACALNPILYTNASVFGLIRRDVLAKTRLIGKYLASDRCLIAELALHGPFVRVDRELFFRRQHRKNIGTDLEFLEFYDPRLKGKIVFPEWRVGWEQLCTIRRSRLKPTIKLKLLCLLGRWVIQSRRAFIWELKHGIRLFFRKVLTRMHLVKQVSDKEAQSNRRAATARKVA